MSVIGFIFALISFIIGFYYIIIKIIDPAVTPETLFYNFVYYFFSGLNLIGLGLWVNM